MAKLQCPECKNYDTKLYRTVGKPNSITKYHQYNKSDP